MMKSWVYGTVAGLALIASACANTAAPDNVDGRMTGPAGTAGFNNGPGTGQGAMIPGTGADNTAFGGDRTTGYYGATVNNAGFRGMGANPMTRNNNLYVQGQTANTPRLGFARVDRNQLQTYAAQRNEGFGGLFGNRGNQGNMGNGNLGNLSQIYVDRDALARLVAQVTAGVPGCQSSQVLVSDEEIFVGLTPQQNQNTNTMVDQARMNAEAVAPGYYKVYCTTNQGLIDQMSRLAGTSTNVNANGYQGDRQVEQLVRQFGGVADGDEMNRGMKSRQGGAKSR